MTVILDKHAHLVQSSFYKVALPDNIKKTFFIPIVLTGM